jgi:hypothetical protein
MEVDIRELDLRRGGGSGGVRIEDGFEASPTPANSGLIKLRLRLRETPERGPRPA